MRSTIRAVRTVTLAALCGLAVSTPASAVPIRRAPTPTPPPSPNYHTSIRTDLRHNYPLLRQDADFDYIVIDPPNSVYTEARSINNSGDIVGYYRTYGDGAIGGFFLHGRDFLPILIPGAVDVFPMRINMAGVIVGTATASDNKFHGFIMQGGNCKIVDNPKLPNTVITGINENGEYVGYSFDTPNNLISFSGKINSTDLTPLAAGSVIWDVNNKDNLVGHTRSDVASPIDHTLTNTNALVVADQVASQIPIQATSKAFGTNNNNDVVGTFSDPHGFLIHDGQIESFDVPGSMGDIGTQAFGINDNGKIVGVFEEPTCDDRGLALHGFLAIPRTDTLTQTITGAEPNR